MPAPYNETQLISFHSTSKGITGECGIRGGYFEAINIDQDVLDQIYKLKSIFLCSNTIGQIMTDLMVNPPN
jgi:aspartate/methionine/tyrosine aminotransferase